MDKTIDWATILSSVSGWILAIVLIVGRIVDSRNKRAELKETDHLKLQAKKIDDQHKEDLTAHEILLQNQKEDRADKRVYEQQLVTTTSANIIYARQLKEAADTITDLRVAQAHLEDSQRTNMSLIEGLRRGASDATVAYGLLADNYQTLLAKFIDLQTKFDGVSAANQTLRVALDDSVTKISTMQMQIDNLVHTIQQSTPTEAE